MSMHAASKEDANAKREKQRRRCLIEVQRQSKRRGGERERYRGGER